jgi:U4/U6.U5 tri-snRNP-associated protein 2
MTDNKKRLLDEEENEIEMEEEDLYNYKDNNSKSIQKCPYLDTVNRQLLDFDSEKLCSVTLTNYNVYCCLVCGKYFQGRGKLTPAYTHRLEYYYFNNYFI